MRRLMLALGAVAAACLPASSGPPSVSPASGSGSAPAGPSRSSVTDPGLRYVALGDSYTIGTSVAASERWPDQLVARLGPGAPIALVGNLAIDGYTSQDVIDRELPRLAALEPQFVSLLIGVNDVVRGVPEATFRENVERILGDLVGRVGRDRIVVVTTPDYTVTPAGADYGDPTRQSAGIRRFNAVLTELAAARGIAVVDIYDLSLLARTDRSLVAADGLHPSGAQYARWVDRIAAAVEALLRPVNGPATSGGYEAGR